MKYLRVVVVSFIVIVLIVPMHVMVTISAQEDEYLKFKHETQDRMLQRLWGWAYGRQHQDKTVNPAGIFTA